LGSPIRNSENRTAQIELSNASRGVEFDGRLPKQKVSRLELSPLAGGIDFAKRE
jgi:hypothetical protein